MKRFIYLVLPLSFMFACSPNKSSAPQPVVVDDLMDQAWENYRKFNFLQALSLFGEVIEGDATNAEAFYGYALTMLQLSRYADANAYASIAVSIIEPQWSKGDYVRKIISLPDPDCKTLVVSVDTIVDTLTADSTFLLSGYFSYKVPKRNLIAIHALKINGINYFEFMGIDDSTIYGRFIGIQYYTGAIPDPNCVLFKGNDTLEIAYEYVPVSTIDSLGWNALAVALASSYFAENYDVSTKFAVLSLNLEAQGNPMKPRIVHKFTKDEVVYQAMRLFYDSENFLMLTYLINKYYDSGFPYAGWTITNLNDVMWVDENVNSIRSKYYEILTANAP